MTARKVAVIVLSVWRAALIVAVVQTCVPIVSADYIPPSRVTIRTKAYQPRDTNFPRGTYEYQVAWQGVPVGSAAIHIGTTYRAGKKMLDVEATARSTKVVGVFYELRHRSQSIFSAQDLKPVEFFSQQTENSRFTNIEVSFSPEGLIRAKVVKGKLNSQGKSEEVVFKSENATFDPITAAFLARSLPINPAEDLSFDIFNGQHRYLISFHVVGREKINVAGKDYDAFKVEPRVKKLTDTQGEKRLRKAFLWVSADESREVLKLESEVFFGSVSAKLVRFVPDTSPETTAGAKIERPAQNR